MRKRPEAEVGEAWHMVSLVLEWIKHADAKAAATLAGAGVLGGLLYTLVDRVAAPSASFVVAAVLCAVAVLATVIVASVALRPWMRRGPGELFYATIADRYPGTEDYALEFGALVGDRQRLLTALSDVVWSNAVIATRKYRVVRAALNLLVVSVVLLTVAAVLSRI